MRIALKAAEKILQTVETELHQFGLDVKAGKK